MENEKAKAPSKMIYICSPCRAYGYTTTYTNLDNAKEYCKMVSEAGCIPICPHLYFSEFLNDDSEEERALGMEMGMELLKKCDEVWVFGKYLSDGMVSEIEYAFDLKIAVSFFNEDCSRR